MDFEQPHPGHTPAAGDVAAVGFPYQFLCQQPIPPECLSRYSTLSEALGSPQASLEDISLVEEGAVSPAPSDQTCSDMPNDESASLVGGPYPSLWQGTILSEFSALAGALGSPHVQEASPEGILPFEEATLSVAPSDQTCSYMSGNESAEPVGGPFQRYEPVVQYKYRDGGGVARSPTAVDYCVGTLDFLPLGKYLLEGIQFMLDGNSRAWGDMNEHHKPSFRINWQDPTGDCKYSPFSTQRNIPKGITKAELARKINEWIGEFIERAHPETFANAAWRVGDGYITNDHIGLRSVRYVSSGTLVADIVVFR
ncbi:hypothetical protein POSPLADRAFT_1062718 [Postia placenta MAD-698-R-SB12]|uniref:Uncharacterized protein n=1 Tax=Postia placenta MAD-698-R-SB12 TaxID=670580 RepID=A0A1X6MIR4_9APHY|nr:hypothetical protein POSPLADRAFT_1062718 [Postia placenta MAD-698-R-SB12]OSX56228.1 hypothetical protein POSPLADRAFT_1062718 [Postia placenta MAD-698-R-SB12]